ncbi:MAG TPA: Ig-like domain-containing protein [Nocardioidaceae bacterium]|nr:Ig-like domain-containing protein [Nocardioidaceae bacterium]
MTRHFSPARARRTGAVLTAVSALVLAGCTADDGTTRAAGNEPEAAPSASPTPTPSATVSTNVGRAPVKVDEVVEVTAEDGTLERVVVRAPGERLRGEVTGQGASWTASDRLEPGLRYRVRAVAVDADGMRTTHRSSFRTEALPLERQTFPSIAPLQGETVGVGMPVIVQFDVPVTDRAGIERHLSVESSPNQKGSWHWVSNREVHWRPRTYWKPGTEVTVDADINSVAAGNGVYGQVSRKISFEIGDSVVSKVNVAAHKMDVFVNGSLARTMPISAGKPGFITRSGTKVIIEKVRDKVMDAATLGIPESDPEYYRLDVEYAMRVTYSGEFLHAAPWSSGSQGVANVSHGCVGMATQNAAWLFDITKRGDVVEVTGSDRQMTLYNGYGDWNASFQEYAEGSAL